MLDKLLLCRYTICMHIREVQVKRKETIHRYAQIVQSYRRPDGMPAHKVIAGLGELPPQTVSNLKMALAASRQGRAVILPAKEVDTLGPMPVLANLRYLDVAVAFQMWHYWGLTEVLKSAISSNGKDVSSADVIAALVIQRCVAPRSKLHAQRWFPTTALPELLGIVPQQFNNTRIHRVLEELDCAGEKLQESLPCLYQQRQGVFASLFLDVTDVYFEGNNCEMAERSRTKEGLHNKRCVGVVLLCNQNGYPLRWEVVPGKRKDHQLMGEMVEQIKNISWVGDVPLVCDRAMGKASSVKKLLESGIRFLTAVPVNEVSSYTARIPHQKFADIKLSVSEESYEKDVGIAANKALEAGLSKVNDRLYVLDMGVCAKGEGVESNNSEEEGSQESGFLDQSRLSGAAALLAQAYSMREQLDTCQVKNQAMLARQLNVSRARIAQIMGLLHLSPEIQEELLSGRGGNISESKLRPLCNIRSPFQQRKEFEKFLGHKIGQTNHRTKRKQVAKKKKTVDNSIVVRLVAYYNPEMFVDQRLRGKEQLDEIKTFVEDLNIRLASPYSHRNKESVRREVLRKLEHFNLLDCFIAEIRRGRQKRLEVKLTIKADKWRRRRRYDGFVLLLGHPDLSLKAEELVLLYRAKDAIEKDFQTIKSVVKLRPIYHYTDSKVRAHVTLCMLALLLERTLEYRLSQSSEKATAAACLEILSTCHLNQLEPHKVLGPMYTITRLTPKQKAILKALDLEYIASDEDAIEAITPR